MEENKWRFLKDELLGYMTDGSELHKVEIGGPSAVEKPTVTEAGHRICSMSIATEDDTGTVFFFNEANGWQEQFSFKAE